MDYSNSSKNDLIALVVARGLAKNKTAARDIKAADLRAMLMENDTANRAALRESIDPTPVVTARAPKPPKMMPGQEPYTPAEMARLNSLVSDAARANVTEADEVLGIAYSEIEVRTEAAIQTRTVAKARVFVPLTREQRARKLARNRRRHKRSLAAWPNGQKTPRQSAAEV